MSSTGFEPIAAVSLVDESHRQIKAQILSGELPAGEALKDSVLAQKMGISRSPVREALRLLEQTGLVQKATNRSYRVADISVDDLDELALLRLADEGLAVRIIVQRKIPLTPLRPYLDALQKPDAEYIEPTEMDTAFHTAVVALAGLPRLSARYAGLTDQIRLMLMTSDRGGAMSQPTLWENHATLYEALERAVETGDPEPALREWERHVILPIEALKARK